VHLLLCSTTDYPGLWAYQSLREIGLPSLEIITSDTLAYSSLWEHRVGAAGVSVSFTLPDGRQIRDTQIDGVLNRLLVPPQELIARAMPEDREYALQETTAMYLSWLHGLSCPVLNRPTPQGLAGRWWHASEWALLAHDAGFAVPPYRQAPDDPSDRGYVSMAPAGVAVTHVVTLDGRTFGAALPSEVRDRCSRLAELSQTRLLGIDLFPTTEDPWTFAFATPTPDLQAGGRELLACVAGALNGGRL